jgi:hypothetical protein
MSFEGAKLVYDSYKHMTTLSTGSIVLLSTFLEKLFQKPDWRFLVIIAFLSFVISVVASVASMFAISGTMQAAELFEGMTKKDKETFPPSAGLMRFPATVKVLVSSSFGGFLLGVAALALFGAKNL